MEKHLKFIARTVTQERNLEGGHKTLNRILTVDRPAGDIKPWKDGKKPRYGRQQESCEACWGTYNLEVAGRISFFR